MVMLCLACHRLRETHEVKRSRRVQLSVSAAAEVTVGH